MIKPFWADVIKVIDKMFKISQNLLGNITSVNLRRGEAIKV